MQKRAPILNGLRTDKEYNLEDINDLAELGLDNLKGKTADRYVHYQNCDYAVVEFKSSSLHKAITQLETTVERLVSRRKR